MPYLMGLRHRQGITQQRATERHTGAVIGVIHRVLEHPRSGVIDAEEIGFNHLQFRISHFAVRAHQIHLSQFFHTALILTRKPHIVLVAQEDDIAFRFLQRFDEIIAELMGVAMPYTNPIISDGIDDFKGIIRRAVIRNDYLVIGRYLRQD